MFTYLDPEAYQMFTNLKINTETNTVIKFSANFTGTGPSPHKITEDRPPVFGLGYLELYYWLLLANINNWIPPWHNISWRNQSKITSTAS